MYTQEYGGYCAGGDQGQLKALIDAGVQYATANDMYVIIDWHILSDGDPNQHKDEAIAFFNEMTAKYANHTNVLYEICNEPNGGTSWSSIKSYANEVIPVIRANDPDAIILVGTPNWSQYVNEAAADPLTGYDNIMYTLHFYAATHKEDLRKTMTTAVEAGLPVFVSEYGICDASGNGAIDEEQANLWVDTLNDYGISYVAWNISNKAETSAIFKSSCTKTSGITREDLSDSGNWLYEMLTKE
jgi:endoglucanase